MHFLPAFVTRASRRRRERAHGLKDTESMVVAMLKWLEGVRTLSAGAAGDR